MPVAEIAQLTLNLKIIPGLWELKSHINDSSN